MPGFTGPSKPLPDDPKKHMTAYRMCLMCRNYFQSSWIGERICGYCKTTSTYKSGTDHTSHSLQQIPLKRGGSE